MVVTGIAPTITSLDGNEKVKTIMHLTDADSRRKSGITDTGLENSGTGTIWRDVGVPVQDRVMLAMKTRLAATTFTSDNVTNAGRSQSRSTPGKAAQTRIFMTRGQCLHIESDGVDIAGSIISAELKIDVQNVELFSALLL